MSSLMGIIRFVYSLDNLLGSLFYKPAVGHAIDADLWLIAGQYEIPI